MPHSLNFAILPSMIAPSWKPYLDNELAKDYMKNLLAFIAKERAAGKKIFPSDQNIFNAFRYTPFDKVKVVIIGQDPYHGENQAMGLLFSVPKKTRIPPSLRNIYKELQNDLGITPPAHGDLRSWAAQGVLLINTVLTVEEGKPGSHQKKGWEQFTDHIVDILNTYHQGLIFVLWGNFAKSKEKQIDHTKHRIICGVHPSPLSANRGFLGCRHFSLINQMLKEMNKEIIDWKIHE